MKSELVDNFVDYLVRLKGGDQCDGDFDEESIKENESKLPNEKCRNSSLLKSGKSTAVLAALKRSLGFDLGAYPKSYPYVEPFIVTKITDVERDAFYLIGGLFALHPVHKNGKDANIATTLGSLAKSKKLDGKWRGVESRFIALLEADARYLYHYIKAVVGYLSAQKQFSINYVGLWYDYVGLHGKDSDKIRKRWAKEFYAAFDKEETQNLKTIEE